MSEINEFYLGVERVAKNEVDKAPYDKTYKGTIEQVNQDGTCSVKIIDKLYQNIQMPSGLVVGSIVDVLFPQNNASMMEIVHTGGGGGGGGGTDNYNELSNKPSINGITLVGNKTTSDLGISIPTTHNDLTGRNANDAHPMSAITNLSSTLSNMQTGISNSVKTTDLPTSTVTSFNGQHGAVTYSYTLPSATQATLGGIKVGAGLSVTQDGTLSATGGGGVTVHNDLTGRDASDAHPMSAITNLSTTLSDMQDGIDASVKSSSLSSVAVTSFNGQQGDVNYSYSLPTASTSTLGGIKVGAGLSITNGVLSATGGGTADSVEWSNVLNKPTTLSGYGITDAQDKITNVNKLSASLISGLSVVATSGSYNDLSNTPTIPSKTSDLTNDSGFISSVPTASANTLGVVKVGSGLAISIDGSLYNTNMGTTVHNNLTGRDIVGAHPISAITNLSSTLSSLQSGVDGSVKSSELSTVAVTSFNGQKGDVNYSYSLPTASASTLGGVKVGSGLSITATGVLSATASGVDYIVEQGTSGIWTYEKWNSGRAELWGRLSISSASVTQSWGAIYESTSQYGNVTYPFTFTDYPTEVLGVCQSSRAAMIEYETSTQSKTNSIKFRLIRGTADTISATVSIHTTGRWK